MRKYLPTLAELIDRLSICQLKVIFISEKKEFYEKEIEAISHDIDFIIKEKELKVDANLIRLSQIVMLVNRYIWENESRARRGEEQDLNLLKMTHSINGIRNMAKNKISEIVGERIDLRVDCLAADLPEELGNWSIFD